METVVQPSRKGENEPMTLLYMGRKRGQLVAPAPDKRRWSIWPQSLTSDSDIVRHDEV